MSLLGTILLNDGETKKIKFIAWYIFNMLFVIFTKVQ